MRKAFSSYKFGPNADVDAMFDDYMKSYKRKAIDERVQEIAEIMHGKDYADVAEITKTYGRSLFCFIFFLRWAHKI